MSSISARTPDVAARDVDENTRDAGNLTDGDDDDATLMNDSDEDDDDEEEEVIMRPAAPWRVLTTMVLNEIEGVAPTPAWSRLARRAMMRTTDGDDDVNTDGDGDDDGPAAHAPLLLPRWEQPPSARRALFADA